jgi:hypothetical protein
MNVKFELPDDLVATLRMLGDKLDNIHEAQEDVAQMFAGEMRTNIHTRGGGTWPPLADTTIVRHGDRAPGVASGATLQGISPFVRPGIAGAWVGTKGAVFMHKGRGRDWRRGFSAKQKGPRGGRARALTKKKREAFGPPLEGAEMPIREFDMISDATQDAAVEVVRDHIAEHLD